MADFEIYVFSARKRSNIRGNIFAPVCHSVHRVGVPGQVQPPDQVHPLGPGTPPWDQVHPPTPAGTRYTPPGSGTPPDQVHPPGPGTPPPQDQVQPPLGPGTPPSTRYTPQDQLHPPGTRYMPRPGIPWTRYTPPDQLHPQDQVHTPRPVTPPRPGTPRPGKHPRPVTPPGPGTPPRTRYTPRTPPEQCMLGDTGNKRAVRILLDCILVVFKFTNIIAILKLAIGFEILMIWITHLWYYLIAVIAHACVHTQT